MRQTKIKQLGENLESHYRVMKNQYGQEVAVPVIDYRDGISYRMMGEQMCKANNRSKFINYNQYHSSPKKKQYVS